MERKIRILINDDHLIVRKGLRVLLASEPGMEVVGEGADGVEAAAKALELQPDVILMDLKMPRKSGVEAIFEIKQANPAARILVLSSFVEDDQVFPAIKAGACGYLLKDTLPEELIGAIRAVYQGKIHLHPEIAARLVAELHRPEKVLPSEQEPLTERELDVLKLAARGFSNAEIAGRLVISERTVSTHITNILNKLHLANRTQAALYALREGLVNLYAQTD